MRALFIGLALAFGIAISAAAQDSDIKGVISDQLNAFEQDDFDQAFTYAAPNIRQIFRTPENFGTMVRRGYPMVWRPGAVTFLDLERRGVGFVQTVQIEDADGVLHFLAYAMMETGEGWKIAGVSIITAPGVAA
ncbi:MAG: DUF4864 domain-containing protein [Pseudomonadota bacterium]